MGPVPTTLTSEILVDLGERQVSLIAGLDSALERGTGTWDWTNRLERGTGLFHWNVGLEILTRNTYFVAMRSKVLPVEWAGTIECYT